MEKKCAFLVFFCILSFTVSIALGSDSLRLHSKLSPKKISLLLNIGYKLPLNNNIIINSGHGLYFEGGIDLGSLIMKDFALSVFGGMSMKDRFWHTSFSRDFVHDYESAINKEQTGLDSAVTFSSAQLFKNAKGNDLSLPGCETRSFHNYSMYYGIILNFPVKYFSGLKIYTGSTSTHFRWGGSLITKQKGYNILELKRRMYGVEVFAANLKLKNKKIGSNDRNKNIGLSVFYEHCDFYNSSLHFSDAELTHKIPLRSYTTLHFLDKYRNENSWGLKLFLQVR